MLTRKRHPFLFCLLFVSLLSVCHEDILSASTEPRKQQCLAKRPAAAADNARRDSLVAAGVVGRGFRPRDVVAAYGQPRHRSRMRIPVKGTLHYLDQWVYPQRLEYVYLVDGRVTDIVSMLPSAPVHPEPK